MSQIISTKPQIFSGFKMSSKPSLFNSPVQSSDPKLKTSPGKTSQKKTPVKQILEKIRTSREPPQINDPFAGLKKLKVEPRKEHNKDAEADYEKEKQKQEELLALLIDDIMSG